MPRAEAEIVNKLGLHARASAKLTQTATAFSSEVWLERNGRRVNAKSIMGVMMLAAGKGSSIEAETEGADEVEAMEARSRRRDLLVAHQAIFDFYDTRLPPDIVSANHFDAAVGDVGLHFRKVRHLAGGAAQGFPSASGDVLDLLLVPVGERHAQIADHRAVL